MHLQIYAVNVKTYRHNISWCRCQGLTILVVTLRNANNHTLGNVFKKFLMNENRVVYDWILLIVKHR
jgi:hypothetical protein